MSFVHDYTGLIAQNDYESNEIPEQSEEENVNSSDEILIQVVKSYPFLYNKQHKDYKDLIIKENAWTEIGRALNLPALECSNRWSRLRQYYTREMLQKLKESRTGSGLSKRKKWILYDYLTFLDEHVTKRKTFGNITPSLINQTRQKESAVRKMPFNCSANADQDFFNNTEDINRKTHTNLYSQASIYEASTSSDAVMNNAATRCQTSMNKSSTNNGTPELIGILPKKNISETPKSCYLGGRKKKTKDDPIENAFVKINHTFQVLAKKFSAPSTALPVEDEDTLFGKLVAAELKKCPGGKKELLKRKILTELYSN